MPDNLCIETICVENRELVRVDYHNARLNKTRRDLWGQTDQWDLADILKVPEFVTPERHKLRIAYGKDIEDVRWELHVPRIVRTMKRVYDNDVDYTYKYNNRENLHTLFEQRQGADEILIIKNGMVSDAFYYNVAFLKDGDKWLTPASYLLPGTQRAYLLDSGKIAEAVISENDIWNFSHIRIFNALTDWDTAPKLAVQMIL